MLLKLLNDKLCMCSNIGIGMRNGEGRVIWPMRVIWPTLIYQKLLMIPKKIL